MKKTKAFTLTELIITLLAVVGLGFGLSSVSGCQNIARNWGGSSSVNLPKGRKLITVTWHADDLWYLTRHMKATEEPETYNLEESSNFGVLQGVVHINEHK